MLCVCVLVLCNLVAVILLKGSGESKVNDIHQRLMIFICIQY